MDDTKRRVYFVGRYWRMASLAFGVVFINAIGSLEANDKS